ncbi:thiamine phosphate synthase [Litorilituus lipolyticus]|uniref:Thiamine-phosphate synthase n=1 Tax=Litorilituus lipolyticus TaxID=2491017 RepID=A0A502KSU3_9GAMM|nr:thiamine phosphate synthase [Litorilituus lipolyticus]TPH13489.1 thiamine phosphate synthase [Litorilituus lipolyticus]
MKQKPIIWTISGSDCSGGAGIAADIKTGHGLGVEVCHLITANTVQNSVKLLSVNPVAIDILQQQFDVLLEDKPPSVIKIGLVAIVEQVIWLTQVIKKIKLTIPELIVVYDPVGQASVGGHFHSLSRAELRPLLNIVDVITPNLAEAQNLVQLTDGAHQAALAQAIYQAFNIKAVIVKGGHNDNPQQCLDYCYYQLNQLKQDNQDKTHQPISYQLSSKRITSHYSHGGGCSFATAFASFLALGYLVRDAFTLSKAFINQGLQASIKQSQAKQHQYYGAFEALSWPTNAVDFPKVSEELSRQYQDLPAFNSLNLNGRKLGLYPVIDSIYWLKRLLPLGLEIIQLRVKNLADDELEHVISEAVELAKDYDTRLFINDYWQLAIKYGAYGVHIGQEDLAEADLHSIQQSGIRLGISTHGCYEFLLAQQLQPSYLAIGAIFPTTTKDMTGQIQGLNNLAQVLSLRPEQQEKQTPVVAIGGINIERAPQVLATGVDSIAVVTAITKAENPELAVAELTAFL